METKSSPLVQVKVTDESKGEVEAVFSTLNVVDKDKDVTLPGAFGEQKVRISAYNHGSWSGELPVGKGSIREQGSEAVLISKFFMETTSGRDHFNVIKNLEELMEWSYGYDITKRSEGTWPRDDPNGEKVQFLEGLKVHEVSPVILGAGVDTRTISAKNANKGAIPYSHTGTTDVNWDSGMMTRRVNSSQNSLRALCAWVDTQSNPDTKSSYKFPHHMVSENGAVGAANTRACTAAIAVLNGGRGGSSIPDSDRQGVYKHVAHHIEDAGGTPPPLKSWEEYEAARKEALKAQMSEEEVAAIQRALTQMNSLLQGDAPTQEDVQRALRQMMSTAGMGTSSTDFSGGMKLFDHLAWASDQFDVVVNRVAEAVAMRAEKGESLAEPTVDMVKSILTQSERLREALAIVPRDNPKQQMLTEQIFRNAKALLYLTGGVEV